MSVGYYFDMTRCVGCRACQVACKDKNRLEIGTIFRNAKTYSVGSFPETVAYSFSASCNHCETPACIASCTENAIVKMDDGTVIINEELCIGCKLCTTACPYMIPQYIADTNKVEKCDGCYTIRQAGGMPACVMGCPNRALDFGDYAELEAKYGSDNVKEIAVIPEASYTNPNVMIKAKEAASDSNYKIVNW